MAKRYVKKKTAKKSPLAVLGAFLILIAAYAVREWLPEDSMPAQTTQSGVEQPANAADLENQQAAVWFLDVGQGDSELIRLADGTDILIDAGTTASAETLSADLKQIGVDRIDYLIGTHPHEDHIGGMARIINDFEIGKFYIPRVADAQTPTTRAYERMLDAASEKNIKLTQGKAGVTVLDQGTNKLELLAPNGNEYKDLNNYSIVAKLTCGERSFLFTGDAETASEKEIIASGASLHADVLKCGHHGSSTSTSAAFLKAVSPKWAVISCGVDNDYGHPHHETLEHLEKAGVQVYRTDEQGTIKAVCDGSRITFQKEGK